jgi:trigger factor
MRERLRQEVKGKRIIMRKGKAGVLAAVFAAAALLTACGNKEYLKDIKAADYVTLGEYTGIEASAKEPVVEDGMVDLYIEMYIKPAYTTTEEVTDRAVETGDTVNIDYTGYIDGEVFDGGSATGASLTIGSKRFIAGFEDGLIGAEIGENVTLNLNFPDPYDPNPDLSGVPVVFEVKVNSIGKQIVPELTEDFVKSLNIEGVGTEKELRDYLYDNFYQSAVQTYENEIESTLTTAVMANCTFKKAPKKMEERFAKNIEDGMSAQAAVQQMTLVQYMKTYYNLDEETYKKQFAEDAAELAQQYIMYQAIADAEGLNPTEEEIQEEIAFRVENSHYESEDEYRKNSDIEMLREQLMRNKVMSFLKEKGKIETIAADEGQENQE